MLETEDNAFRYFTLLTDKTYAMHFSYLNIIDLLYFLKNLEVILTSVYVI